MLCSESRQRRTMNSERSSKLRYPFIAESAWLVKQQHRVYIRHHLLLINSGNTLMSSIAFSGGLAGLAGATAEGYEN